jgi:tetratricopeptide (TPR) repeat protein
VSPQRFGALDALLPGPEREAGFAALVSEFPSSPIAARAYQDCLRESLSPTEHLARYEAAASLAPESALAQYLLARAQVGDAELSRASFVRSRDLDRQLGWPVVGIAAGHRAKGDLFGALEEFERGLKDAPHSLTLRNQLGLLYLELHLDIKAMREFDIALRLAPQDPVALLGRARVDADLGDVDAAIERLSQIPEGSMLCYTWPRVAGIRLDARDVAGAEAACERAAACGIGCGTSLRAWIKAARMVQASR